MTILDGILGINPTEEEVEIEFNKRDLKFKDEESYCIEYGGNGFFESGHYQTKSKTKRMTIMKYEILMYEVENNYENTNE